MKKPEEIKKGLEFGKENCLNAKCCVDECPYETCCDVSYPDVMAEVPRTMLCDALALIQQLEADKIALLEESHAIRKDLFDKIKQLESQVPRWIPVEEPPKESGTYLVRIKYPNGRVRKTWNIFHPLHGWCDADQYMKHTQTHWMEFGSLPEPPKEDAHD